MSQDGPSPRRSRPSPVRRDAAEASAGWAGPGDVNAFFGLALDNLADLVLAVSLLATVFGYPADFAVSHFVPGTAIGVVVAFAPNVAIARFLGASSKGTYDLAFATATLLALMLGFATIAFLLGLTALGWILAAGVAGLQLTLAATGYCLGCRLYFLRWWIPDRFARLAGRSATGASRAGVAGGRPRVTRIVASSRCEVRWPMYSRAWSSVARMISSSMPSILRNSLTSRLPSRNVSFRAVPGRLVV